ncbi:glycosyl hydrolase family 8 [Chthonobacter rhizosphaerae]|uniref:glycosyl hydrolase family 8 n=1 Tax=Chthonobacter rhizosphaerae TaxID=2735553 RepID=UPI0015EFB525|nr:glycosyl hydrolase family 8 [Chthonobacter rhizosphaerae]
MARHTRSLVVLAAAAAVGGMVTAAEGENFVFSRTPPALETPTDAPPHPPGPANFVFVTRSDPEPAPSAPKVPTPSFVYMPPLPRSNPVPTVETPDQAVLLGEQIEALWLRFKSRHVDATGRVIDNANGSISHSEGQGYAMVLAARMGDRATFDRIWAWTRAELMAGGGPFAAWKWDPKASPHVTDPNNATDGDLLISWALALAADRFQETGYRDEAARIARAIYTELTVEMPFGRILLPGKVGFSADDRDDGPVVNLSYWIFPALDALAALTPDLDWAAVNRAGRHLLQVGRVGPLRLPPDWLSLAGPDPVPAAGFDPVFGYNNARIPLYLALDAKAVRAEFLPYAGQWNAADDLGPFVIDVTTGAAHDTLGGGGFKLVASLTDCIVNQTRVDPRLLAIDDTFYYPAALGLLALISIKEGHLACL